MINKILILKRNMHYAIKHRGIVFLLQRIKFYLREFLIIPYGIMKINKSDYYSLDESIDFSFNGLWKLIKPMQYKYEISEFVKYLEKKNPKYILEIGTANGGTLFLFAKIASKDAKIISIDLPEGDFGGGYPKYKIPLYKSFKSHNQELNLIRLNSHSHEAVKLIKTILNGKLFDFIFIDGDHSYEGVKNDFKTYFDLLNDNGVIAFHDIVPGLEKDSGGVFRFWKEVKSLHNSKEIVQSWNQNGGGIGIIEKT